MQRQLAAVLFADVAGYTRLMDTHETETHPRLMALLDEVIQPTVNDMRAELLKGLAMGS